MPNRQLYDRIEKLTKQTLLQLHELEQISLELQKVIEENHNLIMENVEKMTRIACFAPKSYLVNIKSWKKAR